jgi:hypothetical protein
MSEKGKKKTKQPWRHHYIPQFYLKGFTGEDGYLWMFDLKTGKKSKAHPKNVAWQRDFYRWEGVSGAEDFLEREAFAKLDGLAAKVFSKIATGETIPEKNSDDYFNLMQFLGSLKIRTPKSRNAFVRDTIGVMEAITAVMTETDERWETIKKRYLGEEGKDFTREQMREVVFNKEKFTVKVPRELHLETMADLLDAYILILAERNWSVSVCEEVGFICSDYPLVLDWRVPPYKHPNRNPGLGDKGSIIAIPLDKRNVLLGVFEQERFSSIVGERLVALINFLEGIYAYRFLFSPTDDFIWLKRDRTIGNSAEFLEFIKRARGNTQA